MTSENDKGKKLSELGQAALKIASHGCKVFPLVERDKMPLKGSRGVKDATDDPDTIENIWTKNPDFNYGIAAGPSGLLILDIDGRIGEESVAELQNRLGSLPPTVATRTPGKTDKKTGEHLGQGRHLFFRAVNVPVKATTGIVPGLDIRSGDAYVVGPGSYHPEGSRYRSIPHLKFGEIDIAELSSTWIEFLSKPPESRKAAQSGAAPIDTDQRLLKRILAYLAKCDPATQDGTGHKTLLTVANALVHGFCLEPSEAASIAWEHYNPRCQPPWTDKERSDFDRKFQEAHDKPPAKERGWLFDKPQKTSWTEYHQRQGEFRAETPAASENEQQPKMELGPVLVSFDKIEETEVEWLLQDIIPMGMVSVIAGMPDQGKSYLTCWLSSAVSGDDTVCFRNRPIPKGSVILCNAEDNAASTVKPRLRHNGANLAKVKTIPHVLTTGRGSEGKAVVVETPITLEMIGAFRQAFEQTPDCRLLIVDPVSAFWGETNDQKNAEVRVVVSQLKTLAEETGIAIVLVTHLNKTISSDSVSRISGSGGLPAASRASWLLSNDETGLRTVSRIKANLSENRNGFTFRILDGRITIIDQEIAISADEVLQAEIEARQGTRGRKPDQTEAATEWLENFLADGRKPAGSETDPVPGSVRYESNGSGFAWRTVRRAANSLAVVKTREIGVSFWSLPNGQKPLVQNSGGIESSGQVDQSDVSDWSPTVPEPSSKPSRSEPVRHQF